MRILSFGDEGLTAGARQDAALRQAAGRRTSRHLAPNFAKFLFSEIIFFLKYTTPAPIRQAPGPNFSFRAGRSNGLRPPAPLREPSNAT